jgi:antitoxin HicB
MNADRPRKMPVVFYRTPAGTEVVRDMKKRKNARSTDQLTTLDDFLKGEGKLEEFEAVAIKEVLAWQIVEAMKAQNLSRKRLAERMKTSRSQISRLLDPKDGNVTLATLQRAAKIVGRTLRLELI